MRHPALLIAGHGSRDPAGAAEFFQMVGRVRAMAPELEVEGGFIELSPPPLPVAVEALVAAGARGVVVVPAMLLAAGHAKGDIPASIARERLAHPGVKFRYGRDLGIHPDLLAVVRQRIEEAVAPPERTETAVLLMGRGSSDPDANADLYKIARLLHEGSPYPFVEACFAGITGPRLSQGLERCRRLGARWVVVVPYLLFTGVLVERISVQVAPLPSATVARHLWPDDRIARLILARYREAIEGDPRMNCDLCIYRVALPGFEHRVGSAAVPHHHPHVPVTS